MNRQRLVVLDIEESLCTVYQLIWMSIILWFLHIPIIFLHHPFDNYQLGYVCDEGQKNVGEEEHGN